jgi:FKBP-type peptidyl-prolyl cis-trans isomerase SlyD
MTAQNPKVIGFHYSLKNDAGEILDTSEGRDPMLYLAGSGQVLLTLDKVIQTMAIGEKTSVSLAAKDGYGEVNPALKMNVKLGQFPPGTEVKPGLQFKINNEPGSPMFRVINVLGEEVFIDGNHPLAGEALHFEIEITESRVATPEELDHGHAHGAGGHHH